MEALGAGQMLLYRPETHGALQRASCCSASELFKGTTAHPQCPSCHSGSALQAHTYSGANVSAGKATVISHFRPEVLWPGIMRQGKQGREGRSSAGTSGVSLWGSLGRRAHHPQPACACDTVRVKGDVASRERAQG